ncbi:MAG: aminopeptidase [Candidatus Cloacimonetes bacterium]|nr:aminopeptidase [Candidatus Cloacimonadota bacterium]
MNHLPVIAYKIVGQVLGVQKGQVVSIQGEIHNAPDDGAYAFALAQVPLIEELALAVRKKGAFPVIEMSTENLRRRFLSEMPQEIFDMPIDWYTRWAEGIDHHIDVGWRTSPHLFEGISDKTYERIEASTRAVRQAIMRHAKRMVFLGCPSQSLARYYGLDADALRAAYNTALNCDYHRLQKAGQSLCKDLPAAETFALYSASHPGADEQTLELELTEPDTEHTRLADGRFMTLPAGLVSCKIKPGSLQGRLSLRHVYYGRRQWQGLECRFENGRCVEVTGPDGIDLTHLRNGLLNHRASVWLGIGINENIKSPCGYSLFDETQRGLPTLRFNDPENSSILLAASQARLLTGRDDNILGEVLYG